MDAVEPMLNTLGGVPDAETTLHCRGCGRQQDVCGEACGRSSGVARFCTVCGRRLREVAVSPGFVEAQCRDHGPERDTA